MPLRCFGLPALAASLARARRSRRSWRHGAGSARSRPMSPSVTAASRSRRCCGSSSRRRCLPMSARSRPWACAVQPLVAVAVAAGLAAWLALLYSLHGVRRCRRPRRGARQRRRAARPLPPLGRRRHGAVGRPFISSSPSITGCASARGACRRRVRQRRGLRRRRRRDAGLARHAAGRPCPLRGAGAVAALWRGWSPLRRAARGRRAHAAAASRGAGHELRAPLNTLLAVSARLEPAETRAGAAHAVESVRAARRATDAAPARGEFRAARRAGRRGGDSEEAEGKGLALSFSFDPRLPHVCRGAPGIAAPAADSRSSTVAAAGPADVAATASPRASPTSARLRLAVRGSAAEDDAPGRAIAASLAAALGGSVAFDGATATAELPLACDEGAAATRSRRAALSRSSPRTASWPSDSARWLAAWGAETQWLAGDDAASLDGARVHRLIDGRADPLGALSLAHRLADAAPRPVRRARRGERGGGRARRIAACRGDRGAGHRGRARRARC